MLLQSVLPEGLSFAVVGVPLLLIGAGTALFSMISFGMLAAAGGLLVAAFMDRRRL